MAKIDIHIKEISHLGIHVHYTAEQPIDRHLVEITDEIKSVFVNAGIDSTCGRKRASIIHKFMNGTIIASKGTSPMSIPVTALLESLALNHSV